MFDCNCDYCKELEELKEENKKLNVLFADIIEAFTSCSYNDDFEMAQAGKEIYELFYGGKDPKEVFHNAEVPKCSRQLLEEANKANEWHYVKDELPISDKDKFYFVVDKWNEPMIARFYEGVWSNYSTIEDVIAWKEIVLPKEIKENDL